MKKSILFLLSAMALFGCGGGGGGGSSVSEPRVAYVNASPDAGGLAFSLNDKQKAGDVSFGSITSFAKTDGGDYDVSLTSPSDPEIIASESHTFSGDTDNVVLALGLKTTDDLNKRLRFAFGTVDRSSLLGSRVRLILVNALVRGNDQDTTSIDFRNPSDTPQVSATGIAFGEFRPIEINAGAQTFEVRQSDTEGTLIDASNFTLVGGYTYLVLISGQEGTTGTTAPAIRFVPLPKP